ncbi:peptidase C39 family protein [Pseudooceanicola spongiae]|uniref:Uncharacterized protein n=1 Tax=Pseudooceanicola spongiae TaxID=2613965 RepID=A0A7L9WJI5_9RHOB|nr:peptidase C39 family protein [Pseudooceanicola spongiae]QOL79994.1 hypothetical protein F3W81_03635 [Pseudooceanicola spongiae]
MTRTRDTEPHRISCADLPAGAAPTEHEKAAHILAVGLGDPVSAYAVFRQRRTSQMLLLVGWHCAEADRPALAAAVMAFAAARKARLIRATPDWPEAIRALHLADTGRGYAQHWIGPAITSPHDTGQFTQTTGFTCGPVALAMALERTVSRSTEIALWREATTLIGLNGPGGCDPYGVALAAARRGLTVEVWFDSDTAILLDRGNSAEKQELMRFVQAEFRAEARRTLRVHPQALTGAELTRLIREGAQVILLIDQCHTHAEHAPHWVLVHAEDNGSVLLNDPWAEPDDAETLADVDCIPVDLGTLMRMAAYGDPAYHAAIVLRR